MIDMPSQPVTSSIDWPQPDYTRVPFALYHSPEWYALEMERIFRGPTWNYLCLEAELPNQGDFVATYVGDTPVVVSRADDAAVHAFVNRCSHKGALIVRQPRGNARAHTCIYHRWTYTRDGRLSGVPFRVGIEGQGGMPKDFDPACHGPRKLRVDTHGGLVFGTFSESTEPLGEYLGEFGRDMLGRFGARPLQVLGYSRQKINGNWKLYAENLRDTYHASLLHEFFVTYGVDRATQKGGVRMDARHRHNMNYAFGGSDTEAQAKAAYANTAARLDRMRLSDERLLHYQSEFADGMNLATPTIFPNVVAIQINNSLAVRQLRPQGVNHFEIFQTVVGYADDTDEMRRHRLLSANLVGPAGLVSMEDGEAIEIIQRATRAERGGQTSVIEMGGRGPVQDQAHRATEAPVRGFWSYWAELMGVQPPQGIQ